MSVDVANGAVHPSSVDCKLKRIGRAAIDFEDNEDFGHQQNAQSRSIPALPTSPDIWSNAGRTAFRTNVPAERRTGNVRRVNGEGLESG